MTNQNTAILVFANSALVDAHRKPVGQTVLFSAFNKRTKQIVKQSKLPFFWYSENEQVGHSFGERFTNAIKAVYAKGYDNVITIGNDTPHLSVRQLLETANHLKENRCVLGPSTDGGFYLMGLHKSQFNEQLFIKLPWQSRRLTKHITLLLSAFKVDVFKLKVLQDIDAPQDIKKVLNTFSSQQNVALIQLLLSVFRRKTFNITQIPSLALDKVWFAIRFNKGSPAYLNI